MPTTDAVGQLTLVNVGPLTTTFTAPSSCATTNNYFGGKFIALEEPSEYQDVLLAWEGHCDAWYETHGDCYPHGDKLDEVASVMPHVPYYSPANVCPSGYQTVGIAAMSSGSASISGIFTYDGDSFYESPEPTASQTPEQNWFANRLTSALGPRETVVACCPSGYTIQNYICQSTFPASDLASATGCRPVLTTTPSSLLEPSVVMKTEIFEYQGTTYTNEWPEIPQIPTDYEHLSTTTYTFDDAGVPTGLAEWYEELPGGLGLDDEDATFVGISRVDVMYLINGGDENGSGTQESSSIEESSSATESDATEESDEPSAASALGPVNLWRAVGSVMAVWTMGAILGVGLMAAL